MGPVVDFLPVAEATTCKVSFNIFLFYTLANLFTVTTDAISQQQLVPRVAKVLMDFVNLTRILPVPEIGLFLRYLSNLAIVIMPEFTGVYLNLTTLLI